MSDKISNWDLDDISTNLSFKVMTEPNPVNGEIRQITTMMNRTQEEIVQTKSDQIRNALIDLGWTPPESETYTESKLDDGFQDMYLEGIEQLILRGERIIDLPLKDLWALIAFFVRKDIERMQANEYPETPSVHPEERNPDGEGELQPSGESKGVPLKSLLGEYKRRQKEEG